MKPALSTRIESIDILRGLALALMLLVNHPGSWSAVYAPFLHADWHGLTPTDLVFPFFLFVVGASMACSLRMQIQSSGLPWVSVIKRTTLLFLIGFVLLIIPFDKSPDTWRIMGVLQRIALCFLFVAIIVAFVKERRLWWFSGLVLLAYWILLLSAGDSPYSLENNLIRHIDVAILGSTHMWQGKGLAFDPEGLLSTVSASITVLSGYLICAQVLQGKSPKQQLLHLTVIGLMLLALGYIWSLWHPINKSLWTGSFVLVTSGYACLCLAVIIALREVLHIKIGLHALKVYGSNPILIYVLAWLFSVFLSRVRIDKDEHSISLQGWLYTNLQSVMSDKLASLTFALIFTLVFYWLALLLYKKKIFIKL